MRHLSAKPERLPVGRLTRRHFLRMIGAIAGASAIPLVAACGGRTTASGRDAIIQMNKKNEFSPKHVTIVRGAKVFWTNQSEETHTATCDPSKAQNPQNAVLPEGVEPWDSGDVAPGEVFSRTFDQAGEYTYFCQHHEGEGMVGRITVTAIAE